MTPWRSRSSRTRPSSRRSTPPRPTRPRSSRRAFFLPNLNLNVNNGFDVGRNFSQSEGRIVDQTTQSLNTGVSSSVTVFDGFRNVANLNAAKATEAAGEQDLARSRQTVVFTVASNFLNVVAQQEQLRVQEENLAALELQEKQIKVFVDAGARPVSDLYSQQAATANARLGVVNAKRALELAKVDVIQTLQLDPAGVYEFVAPNVTATEAAAASRTHDLPALVAQAYQNRMDLDAQHARVEAAQQSARASASGKWPSIALSAGYNTASRLSRPSGGAGAAQGRACAKRSRGPGGGRHAAALPRGRQHVGGADAGARFAGSGGGCAGECALRARVPGCADVVLHGDARSRERKPRRVERFDGLV
jgi:outer membrane protein TolC